MSAACIKAETFRALRCVDAQQAANDFCATLLPGSFRYSESCIDENDFVISAYFIRNKDSPPALGSCKTRKVFLLGAAACRWSNASASAYPRKGFAVSAFYWCNEPLSSGGGDGYKGAILSSYKQPAYLDDYVNVNVRVSQFYVRFPDGRITTSYQIVDDLIIFQAQVYRNPDDAQPSSTGTAMDKIDVNQSTTEKTETASVGRALAFLNFEVKKSIASREEMERVQPIRSVNSQTQPERSNEHQRPDRPKPETIGRIKELRVEFGLPKPWIIHG